MQTHSLTNVYIRIVKAYTQIATNVLETNLVDMLVVSHVKQTT